MNLPHRLLAVIIATLALAVPAALSVAQAAPQAPAARATTPEAKALALLPTRVTAGVDIHMQRRRYALCAASNITPSDQTIIINNRTYQVGTGLCPIISGWSIYNASLQGSGISPSGPSTCLLYTSPSPRDGLLSRMPSSA